MHLRFAGGSPREGLSGIQGVVWLPPAIPLGGSKVAGLALTMFLRTGGGGGGSVGDGCWVDPWWFAGCGVWCIQVNPADDAATLPGRPAGSAVLPVRGTRTTASPSVPQVRASTV